MFRGKFRLVFTVIALCSVLGLLSSCTNDKAVRQTLRQAGGNAEELKKVLSHYSSPEDAPKRKAARILVGRMSDYYCFSSDSFEKFNDVLFGSMGETGDNLALNYIIITQALDSAIKETGMEPVFSNTDKKYDSQHLTADFLIENIDCAFEAWQNNPWSHGVSFEEFCDYILPYRAYLEPVGIDRRAAMDKFTRMAHGCPYVNNPDSVFRYMMRQPLLFPRNLMDERYPYMLSFDEIGATKMGSCVPIAIYYTMALRSIGLPVAVDYTPHWGNYGASHYSPQLIRSPETRPHPLITNDNLRETAVNPWFETWFGDTPFIPQDSLPPGRYVQYIKTVPKIYRHTGETPPDVTAEYLECSDVVVDVGRDYKKAHLCVFSGGEWIPVCEAPVRRGKAKFRDMGRQVVYMPAVLDNEAIKPVAGPLYLSGAGEKVTITPDKEHKSSMKLISKYPLFSYGLWNAYDMKGTRFEGANRRDFKDAETIHEIDYYPFYYHTFSVEKPFRYYRYISPGRNPYTLAELHFYAGETPVEGDYFDRFYSDASYFSAIADNNLNTYLQGVPVADSWVGFDAGGQRVTQVRYAPKNDANCIVAGNDYELLYWVDGEWVSHGRQRAASDYLEFSDVPQGALYWLRCLTEGREERVFTYENGWQVWL